MLSELDPEQLFAAVQQLGYPSLASRAKQLSY